MRPPVLSRAPHSEQIPAQPLSPLIDSTPLHSITTPRLRRPSYHFTSRTKDRLSHLSSASLLFYPSTECQMLTHDDGGGEIGDRPPLARSVQSVVSHPENIELSSPEAAGRANTSLPRDKNTLEGESQSGIEPVIGMLIPTRGKNCPRIGTLALTRRQTGRRARYPPIQSWLPIAISAQKHTLRS